RLGVVSVRVGDHRRRGLDRGGGDRRADRRPRARPCRPHLAAGGTVQHLSRHGDRARLPSRRIVHSREGAADMKRTVLIGISLVVAFLFVGLALPKWLLFLCTMAAANGLVSLGIVLLMRGGVVSCGQGLVFAAGGYAAALLSNKLGATDALLLTFAGGAAAVLLSGPVPPLAGRVRRTL